MNIKEILSLPEKRKIKTLEALIKEHRNKYYNDIPEITDKEYDKLESELRKLVPNHKLLKQIGAKPKRNKVTFPDDIVIGSLKNINLEELRKLKNWDDIIASLKLDGLSGLLHYKNGTLVEAATRGDGTVGESVLDKALLIDNIPESIKEKKEVLVRGEFIYVGELIAGYKTKRGAASGILLRHDTENLDKIAFITHNLLKHPKIKQTYLMRLRQLKSLGFETVDHFLIEAGSLKSKKKATEVGENLVNIVSKRTILPYLIDGIVLTKNLSPVESVALPKFSVAFKPPNLPEETTVTEIEWRVGRTGRLTPVVHVDVININDTDIDSPTGHNYRWLADKGIGVGARVAVIYSKDVIPYIKDVIQKAKVMRPSRCPECKKPLAVEGVHLVCNNEDCPGRKYSSLAYFLTTLEAENISEKTLRSLGLSSLEKIYEAKESEIAIHPGFGTARAQIFTREVKRTLNTYPYQLLAAFGIPLIGLKTSMKICSLTKNQNFSELFKPEFGDKLLTLNNVGDAIKTSFMSSINKYEKDYEYLLSKGLKLKKRKPKSEKLKGKTFQFTGQFSQPRKKLEQLVIENGGEIKSVTKNLSYLIMANKNIISLKANKAKEFGVKTLTEAQFMEMLQCQQK